MLKVSYNISLCEFKAWSGGKQSLDILVEHGRVNMVEELISELYPDGLTETELNDFLWFGLDDLISEILD